MRLISLAIIILASFWCHAQEPDRIVKYKQRANTIAPDSLAYIYNKLAKEYSKLNYDSLKVYAYKSLKAGEKSKLQGSKVTGNLTMGVYHLLVGTQPDSAIQYFSTTQKLAKEINDQASEAAALYNLGYIYQNLGLFEKSLKINYDLLKLRTANDDPKGMGDVHNSISTLLSKMRRFDEAITYAEKAIKYYQTISDSSGIMSAYINISTPYIGIGKIKEAEGYLFKAKDMSYKLNDLAAYATIVTDLGVTYLSNKEYAKAKTYFKELMQPNLLSMQDPYAICNLHLNMADVYRWEGKNDSAYAEWRKALTVGNENNYRLGSVEAYFGLAELDANNKKYESAYNNLYNAYALRDSVLNEEKNRTITEMRIGYEVDKKEEENRFLTQEGELKDLEITRQYVIIASLGAFLIIIVIGGYYFYRQRKLIESQKQKLLEQKLLQMQLNPHFIFNSLQAIQDYIYTNKPTEASGYLSKFARLMRLTLENSRFETISLKNEIESIENYLALQKLRMGEKLQYNIATADNIDPTFTEIPPMLIQPFVENAVEHGIKPKNTAGLITILFTETEELLTVTITDDGPGFDSSQSSRKGHISLSVEIIKERLKNYASKNKNKPELTIKNLEGKGTQVEIKLPTKI